jgi:hypothetical protein
MRRLAMLDIDWGAVAYAWEHRSAQQVWEDAIRAYAVFDGFIEEGEIACGGCGAIFAPRSAREQLVAMVSPVIFCCDECEQGRDGALGEDPDPEYTARVVHGYFDEVNREIIEQRWQDAREGEWDNYVPDEDVEITAEIPVLDVAWSGDDSFSTMIYTVDEFGF